MERVIQLALADDHKIFRDGIRVFISSKGDINILWEAENGKEMMNKLRLAEPDILIMDIRRPESDGIKTLQQIKKEYSSLKIIVLSMYDDKETITRILEGGANAYLTKTTDAEEVYKAITTCMTDDFYFNELVNAAVLEKLQQRKSIRKSYPVPVKFNEKELKILKLISEDKTTEEISDDVFLSRRTVEAIRQNMKTKVGVKTVAGLLMYAVKNKLLE